MNLKKFKLNKSITLNLIAITVTLSLLLGTSYAAFMWSNEDNDNEQNIVAGNLDLVFDDSTSELGDPIDIDTLLPMSDEEGMGLVPYKFKLSNVGNITLKASINLVKVSSLTTNIINPLYIKVNFTSNELGINETTTLNELANNEVLKEIIINQGEVVNFSLRTWLDEGTPNSEINKSYSADLKIDSSQLELTPQQ